ncbi:MAG: 4-(cytidine 5'-diphospho)-2-C-methyl-D-erythritol kinase [Candidatus Binataceae bacterium]
MVKLSSALAPAKINLFLRIVGRRSDGYHELDSLFVPIGVYDRIRLALRPANAAAVTVRCNRADLGSATENLAGRAASAFMDEFGINAEVMIDLEKNIPVGAGLGGGSSDAGAVLRMLASLERIADHARLARLALSLGADVPYFLDPRPARVAGIGERIAPLRKFAALDLVVAAPPMQVRTADVYGALTRGQWSGAARDEDVKALARGALDAKLLVNDLAAPAMALHPEISELKALLEGAGAGVAAMSGSGGAVFGAFASGGDARRCADTLARLAPRAWVVAAKSAPSPLDAGIGRRVSRGR